MTACCHPIRHHIWPSETLCGNIMLQVSGSRFSAPLLVVDPSGYRVWSFHYTYNSHSEKEVVLLGGDPRKLQVFLHHLKSNVLILGMRFAPSRCKLLLQDWISSKPNLFLAGDELGGVGRFSHFDLCLTKWLYTGWSVCMQKASLTLTRLRHSWWRHEIWL